MKERLTPTPVRITESRPDGEETRRFLFEPAEGTSMKPVQPGQFFALSVPMKGEAAFTYLSLPDEQGRFHALIRRTGTLTRALFECEQGTLLGHRGPLGTGWPLEQLRDKRILILAGGIGLAPLAGAIDSLSGCGRVGLIFGARNRAAQVMEKERNRWKERLPVIETLDQPGSGSDLSGTPLDHLDKIVPELGGEPEAALICGPEVMMRAAARTLTERGLPPDSIWLSIERRMHCGVGLCGHCYVGASYACTDGPTYRWDELSALTNQPATEEAESLSLRRTT